MTTSQQKPPNTRSDERRQDSPNAWIGRMLAASSVMLGLTLLGVGGGFLIDRIRGTSPLWISILGVLGVVLSLVQVLRMGNRP